VATASIDQQQPLAYQSTVASSLEKYQTTATSQQ